MQERYPILQKHMGSFLSGQHLTLSNQGDGKASFLASVQTALTEGGQVLLQL